MDPLNTAGIELSGAFSLRPATREDAEAIRALTRQAYSKWIPIIGREPLPMTADYDEAARTHRIDLTNGRLAALIEVVPNDDYLLIGNVAVSPGFQTGI